MIVGCAHYVRGVRRPDGPTTIEQAAACPRSGSSFVWLELFEPSRAEMAALSSGFGLHELAVEEAMLPHQRPKVEAYDDFHFLVLRTARNGAAYEQVHFGEVHVFLGAGFVIAVRHGDAETLATARARLEERSVLLKCGPAAVVWGILDAIVDDLAPVVEQLENDIETLEHEIFTRRVDATERIYELKQQVNALHRTVHPLLAPLAAMEAGAFPDISRALLRYFRDVTDNLRRIHESVLAQREQLHSAFEANVALIAARQTGIIRQLTIVATVFLPLGFVVGFFGQNFGWLEHHVNSLGDFLVLGVGSLAIAASVLYLWLGRYREAV